MREYAKRIFDDPMIADVLDSESQCNDPEMCINIKYESDEEGWAHAMQVMPEETPAMCVLKQKNFRMH